MMFLSVSFAVAARDGFHERWHTRQCGASAQTSGLAPTNAPAFRPCGRALASSPNASGARPDDETDTDDK